MQGIIAAADFKINTSVLEGVNNKIKQIKRRAYGFRDDLYFGSSSKPPSLNDGGADLFKRVTFDQVLKSVESSRER